MLIVVQERNWIVNSKDIEYVHLSKYYYKDNEEYTNYHHAEYVESHLEEYPNINEYKTTYMIRTNHFAWQELGRYSTEEKAQDALNKLQKSRIIFFMPKEKVNESKL